MQLSKHFTLAEFEKSQTATRKGINNKSVRFLISPEPALLFIPFLVAV